MRDRHGRLPLRTRLAGAVAVLGLLMGRVEGLTFTSPTSQTVFSSTQANTISFTPSPSGTDPPTLDIYLYSTSPSLPLGPTHLRLLASSVSSSLGELTFTAGGVAVLPPGDGYAVVAVPQGQTQAVAVSETFSVVQGDPAAAESAATALTKTSTVGLPAASTSNPSSTNAVGTPYATTSTSIAFNISPSFNPNKNTNTALTQTSTIGFSTAFSIKRPEVTPAPAPGGPAQQGLEMVTSGAEGRTAKVGLVGGSAAAAVVAVVMALWA